MFTERPLLLPIAIAWTAIALSYAVLTRTAPGNVCDVAARTLVPQGADSMDFLKKCNLEITQGEQWSHSHARID